jgi:ribose-phosphate pyrophosphokinase
MTEAQIFDVEKAQKLLKGKLSNIEDAKEKNCIFAGTSNPELAKSIADLLGLPLSGLTVANFADGEVSIKVNDSVRQKEVYIIQPVCRVGDKSVNDNLMQLLLLISTFRRASASKICAVIPYYGYARQDRKVSSRTPISAADVATLISVMGVDRVISVDLHCGQIQGFFPPTVPVDNLNAGIIGAYYFAGMELVNPTVVSPDAGGVAIAKEFRKTLVANGHENAGLAMMIKQRVKANEIDRMDLVGTVSDSDCII